MNDLIDQRSAQVDPVVDVEASFAAHIEQDVYDIQFFGERSGAASASGKVFTDQHGYMMTCTPAHLPPSHLFEYKMRHFVEVSRGCGIMRSRRKRA